MSNEINRFRINLSKLIELKNVRKYQTELMIFESIKYERVSFVQITSVVSFKFELLIRKNSFYYKFCGDKDTNIQRIFSKFDLMLEFYNYIARHFIFKYENKIYKIGKFSFTYSYPKICIKSKFICFNRVYLNVKNIEFIDYMLENYPECLNV